MVDVRLRLDLMQRSSRLLLELRSFLRVKRIQQDLDAILQVLHLSLESRVDSLRVRRLVVGSQGHLLQLLVRELELALEVASLGQFDLELRNLPVFALDDFILLPDLLGLVEDLLLAD